MSKYFKPDTAFGAEAECAICFCMWTDPVEVAGCQHIFCRECAKTLKTCPTCCGPVTHLNTPNHAILRMLMRVRGSCSSCSWTGTYKDFKESHTACLREGESQRNPAHEAETTPAAVSAMQDYFLEADTEHGAAVASVSHKPNSNLHVERPTSTAQALTSSFHYVPLSQRHAAQSPTLTQQQSARWRQEIACTARDYGLTEDEYNSLLESFPTFASVSTRGGKPELNWRDACRLLRFYNYPNHPDDVRNLFDTAMSPPTGTVSFHALCLWLPLNRRNPQQWYAMPPPAYDRMLKVSQVLDVEKTGLFTMEQCFLLAEQYFERDVPPYEWDMVTPLLREKDECIRQSFVAANAVSLSMRGNSQGDIRLPFHDVLLTFMKHVDNIRREQRQREESARSSQYIDRIVKLIRYYEPNALGNIDGMIRNFKGEEESLLMTLTAMYGPEPSATAQR